jgi:putative ergosteryl-3beta-O-L-aspartate hydrolase
MATSRISLYLQAFWVRCVTGSFSIIDRYLVKPKPPQVSFEIKIPSTISCQNGLIPLLFYCPSNNSITGTIRPVIINFHGGGWVFGSPQMDSRWAARVVEKGFVLVSVGYRLAPQYPYPTPIEDCVDAIKWIHYHAEEYNLDRDKIFLSGFSAGGNMAFAAAMMLHSQEPNAIKLAAIISFYPLLDRLQPREEKYKKNPIAAEKVSTPRSWDKLFVDCYIGSGSVDLSSPYLSPGLASDAILRDALPKKIIIYTCSWDALLEEGDIFRERLMNLGKAVGGTKIEGVNHAFDRIPGRKGHPKMNKMYSEALDSLNNVFSSI